MQKIETIRSQPEVGLNPSVDEKIIQIVTIPNSCPALGGQYDTGAS